MVRLPKIIYREIGVLDSLWKSQSPKLKVTPTYMLNIQAVKIAYADLIYL
jgi:hypothetical protein